MIELTHRKLVFMNIHFEPLIPNLNLAQQMVTWYNDPEIASFIHHNNQERELHHFNIEEVYQEQAPHPTILKYVVMDDTFPIGELSITRNFPWLLKNSPLTAWISIVIGEKDYWGKGVAQEAMSFIENKCMDLGYQRIELGVFDHNHRAQKLYQKMGYTELARLEHFTYSGSEWHADIRMEKLI